MINMERYLKLDLQKPYSTFLWGARKTGKSSFLKSHFSKSLYVDFLKTDVFQKYVNRPHLLREEIVTLSPENLQHPIILDEVQKIPLLLDEVHWMIENVEGAQFILCGSSIRKLKQSGSNLLGGRAWRTHFLPLCYPELKTLDWPRIMNSGLLPSHYLSSYPKKLLSSYVIDYLLPEVHMEANIRSSQGFTRFLDVLGLCQGEMLNYSNISRDCGIDAKTVKTYFEILEDMYIGYFLYPYAKVVKRDLVTKMPKFYLFDTGLSHHLKKYRFTEFKGIEAGCAFEHYLFLELMAHKLLNDLDHSINYWRTKDGIEVDFILDNGNYAIECKISNSIEKKDLKGLLAFAQEKPNTQLHLVCTEKRKRLTNVDGISVMIWPIEDFLEALWTNKIL